MKIDLEQLKVMTELLKPSKPAEDKDSFNSLTSAISKNSWLIALIIGIAFFLVNGINDGKSVDALQDTRINSNAAAIEKLITATDSIVKNSDTDRNSQQSVNAELLRNISLMQKDIENISKTVTK